MIYNTDYYGGAVQGANYPWCCVFIWWLFWKTGLSALFCGGQKTAFCPFVAQYAKDNGKWVTEGYRPGDLFLFDWDGDGQADHIGICESVSGMSAATIEGNVGDSVKRMTRSLLNVMGAYRPEYREGEQPSGTDVGKKPKTYTVKSGDTLWGIAEKFYGNGWAYPLIISANNLVNSTIYPGQVLRIPETTAEEETVTVSLTLGKSAWEAIQESAKAEGITPAQWIEKLV